MGGYFARNPFGRISAISHVPIMKREDIIRILGEHRTALTEMNVQSLELFGSVARGEAGESSDVDLLVEFDHDARVGIFHFLRVKEYSEKILGVSKVDLVTQPALHPRLKAQIMAERIPAF